MMMEDCKLDLNERINTEKDQGESDDQIMAKLLSEGFPFIQIYQALNNSNPNQPKNTNPSNEQNNNTNASETQKKTYTSTMFENPFTANAPIISNSSTFSNPGIGEFGHSSTKSTANPMSFSTSKYLFFILALVTLLTVSFAELIHFVF